MLSYESLNQEEKEALAKMNPDIASWLEEEKAEIENQMAQAWTIEKYQSVVQQIKEEMRARLGYAHLLPPEA